MYDYHLTQSGWLTSDGKDSSQTPRLWKCLVDNLQSTVRAAQSCRQHTWKYARENLKSERVKPERVKRRKAEEEWWSKRQKDERRHPAVSEEGNQDQMSLRSVSRRMFTAIRFHSPDWWGMSSSCLGFVLKLSLLCGCSSEFCWSTCFSGRHPGACVSDLSAHRADGISQSGFHADAHRSVF